MKHAPFLHPVQPHWKAKANLRKGWRKTLWRSGLRNCYVCGGRIDNEEDATLEHVVPLSKDGEDHIDNCRLSHQECNQRRGTAEVV